MNTDVESAQSGAPSHTHAENNSLFRREALEAGSSNWLGSIRIATPLSHRLWTLSALFVGTSIVAWLALGHYTRREHVDGVLVPKLGLLSVNARTAGTISSLTIYEGQIVHAGDVLLTLSSERSSAALGDTAANISSNLRGQKDRLTADIHDTEQLADQQANDYRMQRGMLQGQVKQLDEQIALEQRQATNLEQTLQKIRPLLEKGYISQFEIQQQESQELDAEGQIKTLVRERYVAQSQLSNVNDELDQLPLTTRAKLSTLSGQMEQADQQLATNEAERSTVLRAPQDGVVASILSKPGQSVSTGETLVTIIPRNSALEAQLLVPSSAIGFVHTGTRVALHYQAFPYQKFGIQKGTVAAVSRSALTPNEVTSLVGVEAPKQAMFRVDVVLDSQTIAAYGHDEALKANMAVDADLLLDKRRVFEWIFEPLFGMGRRFFGGDT